MRAAASAAASATDAVASPAAGAVSPELVLVDAHLAEEARRALPEPAGTVERLAEIAAARRTMRLLAGLQGGEMEDWEAPSRSR